MGASFDAVTKEYEAQLTERSLEPFMRLLDDLYGEFEAQFADALVKTMDLPTASRAEAQELLIVRFKGFARRATEQLAQALVRAIHAESSRAARDELGITLH